MVSGSNGSSDNNSDRDNGRLIVCVTGDDDIGSKIIKLVLECRNLPYTEIKLSSKSINFQKKLKELIPPTSCVESLPHIFINNKYIGGGIEETIIELQQNWDNNNNNNNNNDPNYKSSKDKYDSVLTAGCENDNDSVDNDVTDVMSLLTLISNDNKDLFGNNENEEEEGEEESEEETTSAQQRHCSSKQEQEQEQRRQRRKSGGTTSMSTTTTTNTNTNSGSSGTMKMGGLVPIIDQSHRNNTSYYNNRRKKKTYYTNLPIELPDGTKTSIVDITERLKNSLPQESITHKNIIYKRSFRGSDATRIFIDSMDLTLDQAIAFGQHLLDVGVILPITTTFTSTSTSTSNVPVLFVAEKSSIYRLQCFSYGKILNSYTTWKGQERSDDLPIAIELDQLLEEIEMDCLDGMVGKIDYTKIAIHDKFQQFEYAICELQVVNLLHQKPNELLAFGLNIYKIMLRYAFIKTGIATSENDRFLLLESVKFDVGGFTYTFREWIDGILRGNCKANYNSKQPFKMNNNCGGDDDDQRCTFCLPKLDYRIHFALNQDIRFGSSLSLPFRTFTATNIDEELQLCSRIFFHDPRNVEIIDDNNNNEDNNLIGLPRFFAWYRCDFPEQDRVLIGMISDFLSGSIKQDIVQSKVGGLSASAATTSSSTGFKFKYTDIDWTKMAINYKLFDKQSVKSEIKGIAKLLNRFITPKSTHNESLRLATLHSLNILDTLPDERFDRITKMVKEDFDVPLVLVSLVDADRQWFKSKQWFCQVPEADETPKDVSFCAHAILEESNEVFVVEDATKDDRFADNPVVTGEFGLRFYAGCNLTMKSPTGDEDVNIGTLCVVDTVPRKFTDEDIQKLRVYAFRVRREIRKMHQEGGADTHSVTSATNSDSGKSSELMIKV